MASGNGPDLVILPQDELVSFSNKLAPIPYSYMSQRTYTDSFINEGQLFLAPNGALAYPFLVDPLVLYWNRDLFANAGIPQPPVYWSDILDIAPKLTVSDGSGAIQTSAIAMGEWSNVLYAKDIIAMLFLQAGDPITTLPTDPSQGAYQTVLGENAANAQEAPADSALQYYTDFANPSKTSYTWNKIFPSSQDAFVAGELGIYLGYASDYPTLVARNPNLNFGVSLMPQVKGNGPRLTFGRMLGLAVPRTAKNATGAATIALALSSKAGITAVESHTPLPPVRRDVAVDTSSNAAASVFVQSGLIARSWLDPNPTATDAIFKTMIESVLSGQALPNEAVANASLIMNQGQHAQ
jgi:ABC-type glycerol-3-phosphate transport system substrate-binding protein